MSLSPSQTVLILLTTLVLVGCVGVMKPKGKSPLAPARMSDDSVVLEIFFVRFPPDDPQANETVWKGIDEQHFSVECRQSLGKNGFRVGLIGSHVPEVLAKLLDMSEKPLPTDQASQLQTASLDADPAVVRRHLQIRAGRRSEIVASETYDEIPILTCESGNLCGQTYKKAQGLLAVKVFPQPDGRVRLEVTPELHHGKPQQRWVGGQGMLRLEAGRNRCVFDELAMSATLSAGNMLVLTNLAHRPGSIGHYFFTEENSGRQEQKLLIVRLAQTQHDDLFDPNEPLPLDE